RLRRSGERAGEVAVSVNRIPLTPGSAGTMVRPFGTIEFAMADRESVLSYELTDWLEGAKLSPAGTPIIDDGAPYRVNLVTGDRTVPLSIEPPDPAKRAESRLFAVPSGNADGPDRDIETQVLYSKATETSKARDSYHIKIYRCATPQH